MPSSTTRVSSSWTGSEPRCENLVPGHSESVKVPGNDFPGGTPLRIALVT